MKIGNVVALLVILSIITGIADAKNIDNKWVTSSSIYNKSQNFSIKEVGNDDVIIGFKYDIDSSTIDMISKKGKIKRVLKPIKAISARLPSKEIENLKKNPLIRYIEPDGIAYIESQSVPWGIDRVNAILVHPVYKGTGVKVAVIDTGIDYNHTDLDNNYIGGYDYVNEDNDPKDDNGHGTHVSGTIAAEDNDVGVIGVAPDAKIYAVKAFGIQGSGWLSDIVPAVYDSADNGANIISMSWMMNGDYQSLRDAINYAYSKGAVLVAAAGNSNTSYIPTPASYTSVIAVVATNETDNKASFSNYGTEAELSAPGVNVYSTTPGGNYGYMSGTSMATPHVSGVAALILSSDQSMTNAEVRERMQTYAIDLGSYGKDIYYGYGLVDANRSVFKGPLPPKSITNLMSNDHGSDYINWTWTDPTESDFSKVIIYIDGTFVTNISKGVQFYNATGLDSNKIYTIGTNTEGDPGYVNRTWINHSIRPIPGTITVCNSGCDYNTISTAVNTAGERDTVLVYNGTYNEDIKVTKSISLIGAGRDTTIIKGLYTFGLMINADDVKINEFTISANKGYIYCPPPGTTCYQEAGIFINGKNYTNISNNNILNNINGISVSNNKNNYILNNNISNNVYGIYGSNSDNNHIVGNILLNTSQYGIYIYGSINSILSNNTANFNIGGFNLLFLKNAVIKDNIVNYNLGTGIWIQGDNNYIQNNSLNYNDYIAIVLGNYGSSYPTNNTIIGNIANSNRLSGIYLCCSSSTKDNKLIDNILYNNSDGISLSGSEYNLLEGNNITFNREYGIRLDGTNNTIYNNYLNNTGNIYVPATGNILNNTKTLGNNIIGGQYIGGNYWANPSGTGFSQTCINRDDDEICDSNYVLNSQNVDFLPLTTVITPQIKTITVDDSGGADYTKIQDAINASNAEDTIEVRSGTYNETINVSKQLILIGIDTGEGMPIISRSAGSLQDSTVKLFARYVTIKGFKIIGGGSGGGISIASTNNTIANSEIYGSYAGIFDSGYVYNIVKNNSIHDNGEGIKVWNTGSNSFENNNVSNNSCGICSSSSTRNSFVNNTVSNNYRGISLEYGGYNTLKNNSMSNNQFNFRVNGRWWADTEYYQYVDTSNLVNGKPIYYLIDSSDVIIDSSSNAGMVYCFGCNNITVRDLELSHNDASIYFRSTNNSKIFNNKIINSYQGILVSFSDNNVLTNNNISKSTGCGLSIFDDSRIGFSDNNIIYDNYLNNTNNICYSLGGTNNSLNTTKVLGKNIIGGPYVGGNSWRNPSGTGFSQTCINEDDDYICDSNYTISYQYVDYLPLTDRIMDVTSPPNVDNLYNITYENTYINWTWTDPSVSDFDKVMIYINGIQQPNVSRGIQYFNATGLIPDTLYEIGTHTVDTSGNINSTWKNHTARTFPLPDTTSPQSVANLQNITYAQTHINWTWIDPTDLDFVNVTVYINGIQQPDVSKGTQYFNATGLSPDTLYEIGTHTVDTSGNINSTWKNHTAKTAPFVIPNYRILSSGQLYYGPTGWRSDFRVGNYGDNNTNVNIKFYNPSGTLINSTNVIIPRNVSRSYPWKDYMPGVSDGIALVGSEQPVSVITFQRMDTDGKLGFWEGIPLNTESTQVFTSGLLYYPGGGWRSGFKVLNIEDTPANVTMYFYNSAGTQINSITRTIQPKTSPYFDWYTYGYNITGGATDGTMKAISDRKIHIIASQAIESSGKVGFWEGIPLNIQNTDVFISGLVYYPGGWRSGFKVANYDSLSASVTIDFYNASGNIAKTITRTIASKTSPYFDWYTYGYNITGGSTDGIAIVTSNQPIKVIASQADESPGTVDFYQASQISGNNTAFTLYQIYDDIERSGIKVANPGISTISATIRFYDQNGNIINEITRSIYPKTSPYYAWNTYAPGVASGSVIIEANGRIVVVASIANNQAAKLGIFRGVEI